MEITTWKVAEDRTSLELVINGAGTITNLRLWKADTFKDYEQAINLNSFIQNTNPENISLTPLDLDEAYFNGVYFIEAETSEGFIIAVTADLTGYKECIIEKIQSVGVCEDCLEKEVISLLNAHTMLRSLEDAIELGLIDEILNMVKGLNIYCSDDCKSCGDTSNIINSDYYTTNL